MKKQFLSSLNIQIDNDFYQNRKIIFIISSIVIVENQSQYLHES